MRAMSIEVLRDVAATRGITYLAHPEEERDGQRIVRTTLSRTFAMDRDAAYTTFADPQNHVRFFEIIKASSPLIPLEGPLAPNEYIVLEHVEEAGLPPRMMLVKYKLDPPHSIVKEAVTDPFNIDRFSDRKRGLVTMSFVERGRNMTELTTESIFTTNAGPVFVRGFIDHVWLNFYERLLLETGEISEAEFLTG